MHYIKNESDIEKGNDLIYKIFNANLRIDDFITHTFIMIIKYRKMIEIKLI